MHNLQPVARTGYHLYDKIDVDIWPKPAKPAPSSVADRFVALATLPVAVPLAIISFPLRARKAFLRTTPPPKLYLVK